MNISFSHLDAMWLGYAAATWLNVRSHQLNSENVEHIQSVIQDIVQQVKLNKIDCFDSEISDLVAKVLNKASRNGRELPIGTDWRKSLLETNQEFKINKDLILVIEACIISTIYGRNFLVEEDLNEAEKKLNC